MELQKVLEMKQIHTCMFCFPLIRYLVRRDHLTGTKAEICLWECPTKQRTAAGLKREKLPAYLNADQYKVFKLYNLYRMNNSF